MRNNSKYHGSSDNDSGLSMGREYSSSFSSGHSLPRQPPHSLVAGHSAFLKILLPDLHKEVNYEFSALHSAFDVKRVIVDKYGPCLVDPINYGLFIPHSIDKAGKFLQEERLLVEYLSANTSLNLEFIYKHRIMWPDKSGTDLHKKINSKINQNRFIDYVIRNDPVKVKKALEKGLDPNFHCSSGETPLTLTAKLSKPIEVITALVSGGAHLDYRATDSLTPLHKATISSNYDAVITLLNFGASANYLDSNGITPIYYNLLYDNSTKCLEKLLHEHGKLGITDKSGLKEIHQASKTGKADHLDLLLAYGADINSRTESYHSTPLHVAAYYGKEDCVRLLLVRGADRNLVNSSNCTAYQEALNSSFKTIAVLIRDFKDSEIHVQSSVKATLNLRRKKSEFDITAAYPDLRSPSSEGSIASSRGVGHHKKLSNKVPIGVSLPRGKCSSQNSLAGCNVFSDNDDTSGSSDHRSHAHSNKEHKSIYRANGGGQYSSMLSLDTDSLSDSDQIRVVVLQRSTYHNYGIDLNNKILDPSCPSTHAIKGVEIGSPAFLGGIRCEDYLLEINGTDVCRANVNLVSKLLNENPNSVVLKIFSSNKYSNSSTDPSLHYEQFIYNRPKPMLTFASADNLNSLMAKPPNCESSTTLNSITTIVASEDDHKPIRHRSHKSREKSSNLETSTDFKVNSLKMEKCVMVGRMRSKSTDKKYPKGFPSNKEIVQKYRAPLMVGYGSNMESLKPILKKTSVSCGVRDNVAIIKSRMITSAHCSAHNQNDTSVTQTQSLIDRQIVSGNNVPQPRAYCYNKSLPQSNSFDHSNLPRDCSLKPQPKPIKPILVVKEPKIREEMVNGRRFVKLSMSEEDFVLPPPVLFQ